jgi:hypothetical protein
MLACFGFPPKFNWHLLDVAAHGLRDHYDKAARRALSFKGPGNVLICWEHQALAGIAKAIGVQEYTAATGWTGEVKYPDSRFDLVWVVPPPYTEITEVRSEKVSVLDDSVQTNASGDVLPTQAQKVCEH